MDAPKQPRPTPDPRRAAPAEIEDALTHWDELSPGELERLATDPVWGGRLRTLQLAEAWLEEQGPSERPPEVAGCPPADELYDYGRGPGARPLAGRRRAQIDRHVLACADCCAHAASLASRPPVPLADGQPFSIPAPARREVPQATPVIELQRGVIELPGGRRRLRPALLVPLAAAAAVLVAVATGLGPAPLELERGWPGAPIVRGESAGPLIAPRDRVLVPGAAAAWTGLAPAAAPVYELQPIEGAERYRIELARTDDSALGAGQPVASLSAEAPEPNATSFLQVAGPALAPGRYTWRAWAIERGLERELGARDFVVAPDPALSAALAALERGAEPARSETAVRLLVERGYLADARALARRQPASPERDAWLQSAPAR